MKSEDYPRFFRATDQSSLQAQTNHFIELKLRLSILIAVSALAALNSLLPSKFQTSANFLIAALLAVALVFTFIVRDRNNEGTWFACRASAESAKSATWRFMMKVSPYNTNDDVKDESELLNTFQLILKTYPSLETSLAVQTSDAPEITEQMRAIRAKNEQERIMIYLENRLKDQKSWYENKAVSNKASAKKWYLAIITMQIIALLFAISVVASWLHVIGPISFLMTIAATLTAWTQTKKHDELVGSYSLAAQELRNIEALAKHVKGRDAVSSFVLDAEEAISREHTMWCVRRNVASV